MPWFECADCMESVQKPKVKAHALQCSASGFSCLDCSQFFDQHTVGAHTSCVTEHEKYAQGATKPGGSACGGVKGLAGPGKPAGASGSGPGGGPGGLQFLSARPPWRCALCNTACTSQATLLGHAAGAKHLRKVRGAQKAAQVSVSASAAAGAGGGAPSGEAAGAVPQPETPAEEAAPQPRTKRRKLAQGVATESAPAQPLEGRPLRAEAAEEAASAPAGACKEPALLVPENTRRAGKKRPPWKKLAAKVLVAQGGKLRMKLGKLQDKVLELALLTEGGGDRGADGADGAAAAAAAARRAEMLASWQKSRRFRLDSDKGMVAYLGVPEPAGNIAKLLPSSRPSARILTAAGSGRALSPSKAKVVVIAGPTAVGKTSLSLDVAESLGGEVISADSVQVYRGLDIGSAKLPVGERRGIPHHLIDVLPPDAGFSAGDFYQLGRKATQDILQRGRVPVVVGGTGLYLRWFVHGPATTPPSTPESAAAAQERLRQARPSPPATEQQTPSVARTVLPTQQDIPYPGLVHRANKPFVWDHTAQVYCAGARGLAKGLCFCTSQVWQGAEEAAGGLLLPEAKWEAGMRAVREAGDPASAEQLRGERNNWYRLERVLELALLTGRPRGGHAVDDEPAIAASSRMGSPTVAGPLDYDFRCFFLDRPREDLYRRIDARAEALVAEGLLGEAKALLEAGAAPRSTMASRAIGYAEAMAALQAAREAGAFTAADVLCLVRDIQAASRQFAHRQLSWFRNGEPRFRWLDAAQPAPRLLAELLAALDQPKHTGGSAGGRLTTAEKAQMRAYTSRLCVFHEPAAVHSVVDWVHKHWLGSGA